MVIITSRRKLIYGRCETTHASESAPFDVGAIPRNHHHAHQRHNDANPLT
jgi:hypothetical protein